MKFNREQYLNWMMCKAPSRPMLVELFGPLVGLEDEWKTQGALEDELQMIAFGFDYVDRFAVPVKTGVLSNAKAVVVEDTAEYTVTRDVLGRTMKLMKSAATIALPLDYPVKTMDDWLKIKPLYEFCEKRFAENWEEQLRQRHWEGALIIIGMPGGFDEPRQLLGEEELCLAFYEQPELIHDMLDTFGNTMEKIVQRVLEIVPITQLSVHEDMAGKSGSLVGPSQIRDFINPYYRRVWEPINESGGQIFQQDSDGNMNSVIDAFLESGLNSMYPMEPAAGMDIVEVRKKYGPQLMLKGGIDKHVLRKDKAAIQKELEYKLTAPELLAGGTVFGLDHRIPNGVPLENYRYYVKTAKELLGITDYTPGWQRMAF